MNAEAGFSLLDVFDLPEPQREIVVYLARSGPAAATTLAQATGLDLGEVQSALDALVEKGRVRLLADGQVDAVLDRVESRTTVPAQFWNAVLTTGWLYSEKDIAILRTAVPILQFARARLTEFSDHGPNHAFRVKAFASQSGYVLGLSQTEHMLLRAGALFHDIGNAVDRGAHHTISQETVENLAAQGELPLTPKEAEVVGLLMLGVTINLIRQGGSAPRLVLELREDQRQDGRSLFAITAGGQPLTADVWLGYGDSEQHVQAASGEIPAFASLRNATFHLHAATARELKVWAHQITPEESAQSLPALLNVHCGNQEQGFDLQQSDGQVVLPITGEACWLEVTLPEAISA